MQFEDEVSILENIRKDLNAVQSIAGMTASYPAWGGDADAVRVINRAMGPISEDISEVIEALNEAEENVTEKEE